MRTMPEVHNPILCLWIYEIVLYSERGAFMRRIEMKICRKCKNDENQDYPAVREALP